MTFIHSFLAHIVPTTPATTPSSARDLASPRGAAALSGSCELRDPLPLLLLLLLLLLLPPLPLPLPLPFPPEPLVPSFEESTLSRKLSAPTVLPGGLK